MRNIVDSSEVAVNSPWELRRDQARIRLTHADAIYRDAPLTIHPSHPLVAIDHTYSIANQFVNIVFFIWFVFPLRPDTVLSSPGPACMRRAFNPLSVTSNLATCCNCCTVLHLPILAHDASLIRSPKLCPTARQCKPKKITKILVSFRFSTRKKAHPLKTPLATDLRLDTYFVETVDCGITYLYHLWTWPANPFSFVPSDRHRSPTDSGIHPSNKTTFGLSDEPQGGRRGGVRTAESHR